MSFQNPFDLRIQIKRSFQTTFSSFKKFLKTLILPFNPSLPKKHAHIECFYSLINIDERTFKSLVKYDKRKLNCANLIGFYLASKHSLAPIKPNAFFALRGAFFKLSLVVSDRSVHCLCTLCASRFCRSALKLKKKEL